MNFICRSGCVSPARAQHYQSQKKSLLVQKLVQGWQPFCSTTLKIPPPIYQDQQQEEQMWIHRTIALTTGIIHTHKGSADHT